MNTIEVTVVRIYTLERAENISVILNYLQNEIKVRGISVSRAVSGFGETGVYRDEFLDIAFSLPVIIEFFDSPDKIAGALDYLSTLVKSEHIIYFSAQANA